MFCRNSDEEVNAHSLNKFTLRTKIGLCSANSRAEGDREVASTYVIPSGGASTVDNILACPAVSTVMNYLKVGPTSLSCALCVRKMVYLLATLHMPRDLMAPQTVSVSAAVGKLQSTYLFGLDWFQDATILPASST